MDSLRVHVDTLFSNPTMFEFSVHSGSCILLISCLYAGDFSFSLLLLKATFLQVGQGAGIPPSKHREAPDASGSWGELLWRGGAADRTAHRATGHVAVYGRRLETETGV